MARLVYSLLWYLLLPAVFVYFLWRGLREPDYLKHWRERLGYGRILAADGIWVHAASVGEVQAAAPLVHALRERYPRSAFVITVFTPTGRERATEMFDGAAVRYLPLDLPGATQRFLRRVRPRLGVIVETELWPNLLHACGRDGLPLMLVNARISQRSAQRYARWPLRKLMRRSLAQFSLVGTASRQDTERFLFLGVPAARIEETGNLKFDLDLPADVTETGRRLRDQWGGERRPVWVAASTHQGEETAVLDALAILRRSHPDVLLVLAPRHPQRFEAVAALCAEFGFETARRSVDEPVRATTAVLLGDTLGDLLSFYAAADVAFVGGSLVPGIGGHNLLEPAALRLPVTTGEHLDDWAEVADWLQAEGALCRVADAPALAAAIAECLDDTAGRMMAGVAAERVVQTRGGALERNLRLIPTLMTPGSAGDG